MQDIIVGGTYRHFKHVDNVNSGLYRVLAIVPPFNKNYKELIDGKQTVIDERTRKETQLSLMGNLHLHHKDDNNFYVLYRSIYDNKVYIRELKEFTEKLDKDKYPNYNAKYRFEFIGI